MTNKEVIPNLHRRALLQYSVFAFPLAFAGMPIYINAPDYYATQFGLSLTWLGLALLALRFIDAVQDLIIGYLCDRYAAQRLIIIIITAITLAAGFIALFCPPTSPHVLWFATSMYIAATSFSILTIIVGTLGGLWSHDAIQKTRISAFREAITLLGLLTAVVMPVLLQRHFSVIISFHIYSLVLAVCIMIALYFFTRWYWLYIRKAIKTTKIQNPLAIFSILFTPKATSLRQFYLVYALSSLASSLPAVLVLFFIRDRLAGGTYAGIFLLLYFLSGVLGMPFWLRLARRFGKRQSWLIAIVLALLGFVGVSCLTAGDYFAYAAICVVTGIAFGAELALPSAILADYIDQDHCRAEASQLYAILAFVSKATFAIAAAIAFPWLDAFGFHAASTNNASALLALTIAYAVLPSVIKAIAAYTLFRSIKTLDQGDVDDQKPTFTNSNGANHVVT